MLDTRSIMWSAIFVTLASTLACTDSALAQEQDMVPQEEIENTYRAKKQGQSLYRAGKYEEAIPYLEFAAQRGFKQAQSQLGSILVNGLGGVPKDIAQGVAWLALAASDPSDAEIKKLYREVWQQIPSQHHETLRNLTEQFRQMYGGQQLGVSCELGSQAGSHARVLKCKFRDEVHYSALQIDL